MRNQFLLGTGSRCILTAVAGVLWAGLVAPASAVTVSYTHEVAPASIAGDVLLGVVPNAPGFYTGSFAPFTPAIFSDGNFANHGFAYGGPWTMTFDLGSAKSNLGSVDIWIQDGDPGRWYLPSGRVSVSLDGAIWTNQTSVDNTVLPFASPDAELNRIHLAYAYGEVASFRYLRIEQLAGAGSDSGTPRIGEVTAFLNNTPPTNGSTTTAVPEPVSACLFGLAGLAAGVTALRRRRA